MVILFVVVECLLISILSKPDLNLTLKIIIKTDIRQLFGLALLSLTCTSGCAGLLIRGLSDHLQKNGYRRK